MSNVSMIDGHIDEPERLTDEDIIKALEICVNYCDKDNCEYNTNKDLILCMHNKLCSALNLINRQKAEIERIRNALIGECMLSKCSRENEIKTEAYKEIVAKLKEHMCSYDLHDYHYFRAVDEDAIDEVLKEMVGEQDV